MVSIGIIGAGFSGTALAAHLLQEGGQHGPGVVLFERSGRFGPGLAYATPSPAHLLNVPAGRMSAFDDDPDHFLRWASARREGVTGGSFVPRGLYGQYVACLLDDAAAGPAGHRLRRVVGTVTAARPTAGGVEIRTAESAVTVDLAVLATGNPPPSDPPCATPAFWAGPRAVRDPWAPGALADLAPGEPLLLIGTGLTMMDIALDLSLRGHRGTIHALSRRGLVSQPHRSPSRPYHAEPPADLASWPASAHGMLRRVRAHVDACAARGIDWREAITSLRADTPALWRRLGLREQARFLRHARAYWDTHRHRAAPETWATVERLMAEGRLNLHAGRLLRVDERGDGLEVQVRRRGDAGLQTLRVARVINCTGPETDPAKVDDPLLRDLLGRGVARRDPLGLGLDTTTDYRVIGGDGAAWDRLFALGPVQRPLYWETTAVPELRGHALRLARALLGRA